jgi:DNA-binding NarL/FixJ family response regulator
MRVYLVEDAPMLRTRLEQMIAAIPGAENVGHASGAQDAVEGILREQPDVVVLDIHLTQGNGFDVMRALQQAGCKPRIYVLTNYPMEAYRQSAARLGASGFFDKSSEIERLREALAA